MKNKEKLKKEFDRLLLSINSCQADNPDINALISLIQKNFKNNGNETILEYLLTELHNKIMR